MSVRLPPGCIPAIPSSQPLTTCPAPILNSIGWPRVRLESKTLPFSSFPV